MRIFGKVLQNLRLSRRLSCTSTSRRYSSQMCTFPHYPNNSSRLYNIRHVQNYISCRYMGNDSGNSKNINCGSGGPGSSKDHNEMETVTSLSKEQFELNSQTKKESPVKVLVIPLNIFQGANDDASKLALTILREHARQIEATSDNFNQDHYQDNIYVENGYKSNQPFTNEAGQYSENRKHWQTSESNPETALTRYEGFDSPIITDPESTRKHIPLSDSLDVMQWNDSKPKVFVKVPQNFEDALKQLAISSMQLAFELDMTNIKDAIMRASRNGINFTGAPFSRALKDPTLALTTSMELDQVSAESTVPLNFNALIRGVVKIDTSKISMEQLENIPVPEFNEYVTALAANICGTALQKGFPLECSSRQFSTTANSSKGGKARSPHVICVREGNKGCVSPGNADLPKFVSDGASIKKDSDKGCKSASSQPDTPLLSCSQIIGDYGARGLMSCKAYARALKEAERRREALKKSDSSCKPKTASKPKSAPKKAAAAQPKKQDAPCPPKKQASACTQNPELKKKAASSPCTAKKEVSEPKKCTPPKEPSTCSMKPNPNAKCSMQKKPAAEKPKKVAHAANSCPKPKKAPEPTSHNPPPLCSAKPKPAENKGKSSSGAAATKCASMPKKAASCPSLPKKEVKKDECPPPDPCAKNDPCARPKASSEKCTADKPKDKCLNQKKGIECAPLNKCKSAVPLNSCSMEASKKDKPCDKPNKKSPCKSEKKKEDPCKKKKEDPCKKKKEDPCKKKEDPCKKKEDPCKPKSKKEDPCKPKSKKEDPCKKKDSAKKQDPCKKKDSGKKEDPCKKKDGDKKNPNKCGTTDPCKIMQNEKKDKDKNKCGTSDPCKSSATKKEDKCGGASKKKDDKKCGSASKPPEKPQCGGSSKRSNSTTCNKSGGGSTPSKDTCDDAKRPAQSKCGGDVKDKRESKCKPKKKKSKCGVKKSASKCSMKKKESKCSMKKSESKCGEPKKKESKCQVKKVKSDSKCGQPKKKESKCEVKKAKSDSKCGSPKKEESKCKPPQKKESKCKSPKKKESKCGPKKNDSKCGSVEKKKSKSSCEQKKDTKPKCSTKNKGDKGGCKKFSTLSLPSPSKPSNSVGGQKDTRPRCRSNDKFFCKRFSRTSVPDFESSVLFPIKRSFSSSSLVFIKKPASMHKFSSFNISSLPGIREFSSKKGDKGNKESPSICQKLKLNMPMARETADRRRKEDKSCKTKKCFPDEDCPFIKCKPAKQTSCAHIKKPEKCKKKACNIKCADPKKSQCGLESNRCPKTNLNLMAMPKKKFGKCAGTKGGKKRKGRK